ncbi:MAG TPA: LysR family transcriptional regulator [Streptosporangiaceae bacterium]|nr:LysR family transcriptional regulator [Streptosporangiaceae bacterium]
MRATAALAAVYPGHGPARPLSHHVPDLAALEVLLGVANAGSLNSAAEQIGVSQQAVSARIRAMEAQIGVTLLRRTPRGSRLTGEGVIIAQWAGRLLGVAAAMDAGIDELRQDRRSRLRVSASLTIAELLLPGWLASFQMAQGSAGHAVEITLTAANTETVFTHVTEGSADVGFTEGPRKPMTLCSKIIGHDRLAVVVAPGHPWGRRRVPVAAAELASTPLVSRENGSGTRDTLSAALAGALGPGVVQAPPALSLSTTTAVRAAVLAGAAPAVISELAIAEDLAAGRLIRIGIPGLDLRRSLRAVWAGTRNPPAGAVRDVIAYIIGQAQPREVTDRRIRAA